MIIAGCCYISVSLEERCIIMRTIHGKLFRCMMSFQQKENYLSRIIQNVADPRFVWNLSCLVRLCRPTHAFSKSVLKTTAGQKIKPKITARPGGNVGPMNSQIPILINRGESLLLPVRQLIVAVFVVVVPVLSITTNRNVRSGRQEKQQQ